MSAYQIFSLQISGADKMHAKISGIVLSPSADDIQRVDSVAR